MAPTWAVPGLFFLTTILTLIGPQTILRPSPAKGDLVQRVPPFIFTFSRKPTTLWIFFGTATFSKKFLMFQKGPPFEFFHILQLNVC